MDYHYSNCQKMANLSEPEQYVAMELNVCVTAGLANPAGLSSP